MKLKFLGLMGDTTPDWATAPSVDLSDLATKLHETRLTAMQTKDFSAVDALKSALTAAGVQVRMSKEGVDLEPGPDFDAEKLNEI